jgi:4-oxalomesaconate tautomerase
MQFSGGSSKGLYFNDADLPVDETGRNKMVLAAMEDARNGDPRQIDGLGGGTALTSNLNITISFVHRKLLSVGSILKKFSHE